MKHRHKAKGGEVITLKMAQQLKTKKKNVYQDNYFAVSVKLKTHCVDDQDKVQFGTDTNNEFTEYKHQRKSSNQLAFHLSAYMHLRKLLRTIFQKHTKYKLTV